MDRFWSKVEKSDGCWLWTAGCSYRGYGKFSIGGKYVGAHRVAYEERYGPIPEGLSIDHLCRVPRCVNPEHLEAVTHRENVLRGTGEAARHAAKTHCPQGHPYNETNTYVSKQGKRFCRECLAASSRRRRFTDTEMA